MKFLLIITLLSSFLTSIADNNKVTVYYVDRDDYSFENVIVEYSTQNELDVDYNTVVFVCDRNRNEVIDGVGFYSTNRPSKALLKEIVDEAVQNLYKHTQFKKYKTRKSLFEGILNLAWNMPLEQATEHLKGYGITVWSPLNDNSIVCFHDIYWDGFLYKSVVLEYSVSNDQQKRLSAIKMIRFFDNQPNEAKEFRDRISRFLKTKFGENRVVSEVASNGFKNYQVFDKLDEKYYVGRIVLDIIKNGKLYAVQIKYSSMENACKEILENDEQH